VTATPSEHGIAIAVVGLAARVPGAPSMPRFRELVRSGRSAVRRFSTEELRGAGITAARLNDRQFVPAKGAIEDADCFDFAFFGMTPALARAMDPQHRLFLECCWHALEDAGCSKEPAGRRVGVFAGASAASSYYHSYAVHDSETAQALDPFQLYIVNQPAALSNQVSFHFDLTGPSVTVQTACSTGLATVVNACQSLVDYQCDAAIAGAVTVSLPLVDGYVAPSGSILSPSGACSPFDASADGTVPGDGVAAVVLKRLDDALRDGDRIYAVIRGYGLTNDGARKVGFSAPSAQGQATAIADAIAMAEIDPRDIGFLETHGTGTALGDAIEISALRDVFSGCPAGSIALGAVKAQIGHLDVAAGLAGFIKAVIAVEEGIIPPLSGARNANSELWLDASPFRIPKTSEAWTARPRRAGVSSFGMGGTNVHVVIEEVPAGTRAPADRSQPRCSVVPLSAPSADGLERMADGLASFMAEEPGPNLTDVGTTLARRRRVFDHRLAVVSSTVDGAARQLREATRAAVARASGVVFAFTGQGSQQLGLARALHRASPSFAEALDLCRADLADLDCDVDPHLFGSVALEPRDRLADTEIAQPTLFAFGYAYAAMLQSWGLSPSAMIGHSLGEYIALCVAGALSRKDALALVVARGRAMQKLPEGAMLAVGAPAATVERYLGHGAEIAAHNGPSQLVVAGPVGAIEMAADRLTRDGIRTHRLASRRAFHTAMVAPSLQGIVEAASKICFQPPRIPVASNLTGRLFATDHAAEAEYFAQHARSPVQFGAGVLALVEAGHRIFLEIGAGTALVGLIRANSADLPLSAIPVMPQPGGDGEIEQALNAAALAWTAGADLEWGKVDVVAKGRVISLPAYPFARTRCWVGSGPVAVDQVTRSMLPGPKDRDSNDISSTVVELWEECLGHEGIKADDDYHRLGGDSLSAVRIAERLSNRFGVVVRPNDFLRASTPRLLSALIAERRRGDAPREGVVIELRKPDAGGDVLVLFHAIGGTVHLYGELISALADRPIRLVQALPFAGPGSQPNTIEDMTAAYLVALDLDRDSPVHFAGASFGGLIAFEAAQRWRAKGGSVASVIMLDSPAPGDIAASIHDEADALAFMARLVGRPVPAEELRSLSPAMQRRRIVDLVREHLPDGLDGDRLGVFIDVFRANAQAMNNYRPAPSDGTPVTLIAAETRDQGQPSSPEKGWALLTRGQISVETVPGGHLSMLAEPHVKATARAIERAIVHAGGSSPWLARKAS
jgi:phthiocerol/phenolphthiocerol synthesis type-I polyketide synthase E